MIIRLLAFCEELVHVGQEFVYFVKRILIFDYLTAAIRARELLCQPNKCQIHQSEDSFALGLVALLMSIAPADVRCPKLMKGSTEASDELKHTAGQSKSHLFCLINKREQIKTDCDHLPVDLT